jgi:hypothetical protein
MVSMTCGYFEEVILILSFRQRECFNLVKIQKKREKNVYGFKIYFLVTYCEVLNIRPRKVKKKKRSQRDYYS